MNLNKLSYRGKFLLAFISFILFWFIIFYPKILPYLNTTNIAPWKATILFETLFYLTLTTLSAVLLGQNKSKHLLKISLIIFLTYHVLDAVEPPFIIDSAGNVDSSNTSAVISWDYAIGTLIHDNLNTTWKTTFYIVNILFPLAMLLTIIKVASPGTLSKITKQVLE
jgi:hypothetical protein